MLPLPANAESLTYPPGVEIPYAGEVPLPPNVRPVIILSGSDYEMGYQFYQQLIQIFGPWILERVADGLFYGLLISVFAFSLIFLKPTIGHPFQDPWAEYLDELLIELISHFII